MSEWFTLIMGAILLAQKPNWMREVFSETKKEKTG